MMNSVGWPIRIAVTDRMSIFILTLSRYPIFIKLNDESNKDQFVSWNQRWSIFYGDRGTRTCEDRGEDSEVCRCWCANGNSDGAYIRRDL